MPSIITRYVNTNSTAGGNGTTSATGSGDANRAYANLSTALSASYSAYPDLVASDIVLKIDCAGGQDTSIASYYIPAFTTDETRYLWLYCSPTNGHTGSWDTSKYHVKPSAGSGYLIATDNIKVIKFEGLQIENPNAITAYTVINAFSAQDGSIHTMDRCFIRTTGVNAGDGNGLRVGGAVKKALRVTNNIFQGKFQPAIGCTYAAVGSSGSYIYNNTIVQAYSGILLFGHASNNPVVEVKNNIVSASNDNYVLETYVVTSNNISSDATSPDTAYRSRTVTFVDAANNNFQLSGSDTQARTSGSNLTTASYAVATDVSGQTRPTAGSWDIGASQYFSSVAAAITGSYIVTLVKQAFSKVAFSRIGGTVNIRRTPLPAGFSIVGGVESIITVDNVTYKVHTFTASADLVITTAPTTSIDYLVVAGGGAGPTGYDRTSGGGGAGGFRTGSMNISGSSTYTVVVGAGGSNTSNGNTSTLISVSSTGGGRGGYNDSNGYLNAASGGSGGGAHHRTGFSQSGSGTTNQGNDGGVGYDSGDTSLMFAAGGGGGAGQKGGNASTSATGRAGAGGSGSLSAINGTSLFYAGGGGGGAQFGGGALSYQGGAGGPGGGGSGSQINVSSGSPSGSAQAGSANTGGGGGGGSGPGSGGPFTGAPGGSGIVIIRYQI